MPRYLFEASYSPEGAEGVASQGGSARREAIERLFQSAGGRLEGFFFAFGDVDVYAFGELPGNEAAARLALTVNASGRTTVRTVVLLTPEELDAAAEGAVDYTPPGE